MLLVDISMLGGGEVGLVGEEWDLVRCLYLVLMHDAVARVDDRLVNVWLSRLWMLVLVLVCYVICSDIFCVLSIIVVFIRSTIESRFMVMMSSTSDILVSRCCGRVGALDWVDYIGYFYGWLYVGEWCAVHRDWVGDVELYEWEVHYVVSVGGVCYGEVVV